jgi:hypothetical protein
MGKGSGEYVRICKRCGKRFKTTSKKGKICLECVRGTNKYCGALE